MAAPNISNLISWWTLDETSGTRYDSHGSSDLADINTVGYATGLKGNAADFELSNSEYLSRNLGTSELSFGDEAMTWTYWVKHETDGDTTPQRHISIRSTVNPNYYPEVRFSWAEGADTFEFMVWDTGHGSAGVTWSGNPTTGTWYFIVGWHDPTANTINIQVNNGTVDSVSHSNGIYDGGGAAGRQINIGRLVEYTQYMDGLIDEVCVWNSVLSSDERTWLYNSGAARTYSDLFPKGQVILFM